MKEGATLRNLLKINDIRVRDVIKRLGVSSSTVYQYFASEQLSLEIRERFRTEYGIDTMANSIAITSAEKPTRQKTANISAADYLAQKLIETEQHAKQKKEIILTKLEMLEEALGQRSDRDHAERLLRLVNEIKAFYH